MTNRTDATLISIAERLAVEVCGLNVRVVDRQGIMDQWYHDGEKPLISYDNWKPWLDLNQAWMVANSMNVNAVVSIDKYHMYIDLLPYSVGALLELKPQQAARAIFDAAVTALGLEAGK